MAENKAKNQALRAAKKAKNDEFYTQIEDIEKELFNYKDFFLGKKVLCNCDDPYESNFFKYFALNFKTFGLKQLVATCYSGSPIADDQLQLFANEEPQQRTTRVSHKIIMKEPLENNTDGSYDMNAINRILANKANALTKLKGNGDFRSDEIIELLKDCDVVVTNPPFSLFREYVAQLMQYEKKFIIIGNQNAITYKEILPYFMQNKLWLGYLIGGQEFSIPTKREEVKNIYTKNGKYYAKMGNICWFTNIDIKKRHEKFRLAGIYSPQIYPKYDNYDAIEVSKVINIPEDYEGVMGVPVSFLDKYNPEQFQILGASADFAGAIKDAKTGKIKQTPGRFYVNGKRLYERLLIRNKIITKEGKTYENPNARD